MNVDLKSGIGPAPVLELLGLIAEAMAREDSGEVVPSLLLDDIAAHRQAAQPYLVGGAS